MLSVKLLAGEMKNLVRGHEITCTATAYSNYGIEIMCIGHEFFQFSLFNPDF